MLNQQAGGKRLSQTEAQKLIEDPLVASTFKMGRHGVRQHAASSRRSHREAG